MEYFFYGCMKICLNVKRGIQFIGVYFFSAAFNNVQSKTIKKFVDMNKIEIFLIKHEKGLKIH